MTDLLELALADPERAWTRAEGVVADSSDPRVLSIAHQARGIVLRDSGRADEAVSELRTAIRYAGRVDPEREADVRATYGVALVMAGSTTAARRQLDRAAASVDRRGAGQGPDAPRVRADAARRSAPGPGGHAGGPGRHPALGKPDLGGAHAHHARLHRDGAGHGVRRAAICRGCSSNLPAPGRARGGPRCARRSWVKWRSTAATCRGRSPSSTRWRRRRGGSATNAPTSPSRGPGPS